MYVFRHNRCSVNMWVNNQIIKQLSFLKLHDYVSWPGVACLVHYADVNPVSQNQWSRPFSCVCAQLCPTLCNSTDYSSSGSSVHRISQARIPEWVAISSSRGSSRPMDQICVSGISCIADRFFFFTISPTWEGTPSTMRLHLSFLGVMHVGSISWTTTNSGGRAWHHPHRDHGHEAEVFREKV